jgi:hypothetical protein
MGPSTLTRLCRTFSWRQPYTLVERTSVGDEGDYPGLRVASSAGWNNGAAARVVARASAISSPMLDLLGWCDSQRLPKAVAVAKALKNTARVRARIAILSSGTRVLEALKQRTGLMRGLSTTVADACFAKPLDLEVDDAARHFCRA